MVCGTGRDVGKSHLVAGLCRVRHHRDVPVAPFKASATRSTMAAIARGPGARPWLVLDGKLEGAMSSDGRVFGTSPHGLFESDGCRRAFPAEVGRHRGRAFVPGRTCFVDAGQPQLGRLGDLVDAHLDLGGVEELIRTAA
jgi:cobyric acid synthase